MPLLTIAIDSLSDDLLARKTALDDYTIGTDGGAHGRLTVGRIMRVARASDRTAFFWTITGPAVPDAGIGLVGEAEDLAGAKADLRQAFDRVLHWAAMRKDGEFGWHGGSGDR